MKESLTPPDIEIIEATYAGKGRFGKDISFGPVSLKIGGGEFFSILGSAEAHKEVLLRMIAGLDSTTSGEIRISGKRVQSIQDSVGMVFKEPSLLDWRTGLGNALLISEARRLDPAIGAAQARRLLATMGVSHCQDQKPPDLSAGFARRISICRALVPNPSLLLMEDFLSGLDGLDREQIATDIQRLWLTSKITIVLCTTCINEAIQLSDRVAVMGPDGRVLQTLSIDLPRPRRMDKPTTPQIAEYGNFVRTILHASGILS